VTTRLIAIIPVKSGSTRLPEKNMRYLLGKTLLQRAIDYVRASKRVKEFYVSTNDKAIAKTSRSLGAQVIIRPEQLTGETPLIEVYRHALEELDLDGIELMAGVQVDHPDRHISLDDAIDNFEAKQVDRLYSIDGKGGKNGAHLIMKVKSILSNHFNDEAAIVDDCTNIHYESDLVLAEKNLMLRIEESDLG